MPFRTSVSIRAPMKVPNRLPTPPKSDAPPIRTAAIAGSVSGLADIGFGRIEPRQVDDRGQAGHRAAETQ